MKHLFELPAQFPDMDDKIVIISYGTHANISDEFEKEYNTACADKWHYEGQLNDALFALTEEQKKPESLQDRTNLNSLAAAHETAVKHYEQSVKRVHDLEQTLVPVTLVEKSLQITIATLGGPSVLCSLSFQDLQEINYQIEKLKKTVASCHERTFHEAIEERSSILHF